MGKSLAAGDPAGVLVKRFEDVVETLDRHAGGTQDDERKVDLLLQAVRVLTVSERSKRDLVTLYGLTIVAKRRVHYGPLNPPERLANSGRSVSMLMAMAG